MQVALVRQFWDEDRGFLMNPLNQTRPDPHYYAGSLIAAHFGLLDQDKTRKLLETARCQLLDDKLGVYIAAPFDFHELIPVYHFNGMEMGEPYFYFNGGVWPHGNAWYILGLLASGEPDQAQDALKKYLTLAGIQSSPNGTPSFYEYRYSNPGSPDYGKIDKPTFLWAAGWYLYDLYNLCGVRENPWNISFSPELPGDFSNITFDVCISGHTCRVAWEGEGRTLRRILMDGRPCCSAVIFEPCDSLLLQRGIPDSPYITAANCRIGDAEYNVKDKKMTVSVAGMTGQVIDLQLVSPVKLQRASFHGGLVPVSDQTKEMAFSHCPHRTRDAGISLLSQGQGCLQNRFQRAVAG